MKKETYLTSEKLFIPSSTGEYTPTNITTEYDADDELEEDTELDDELTDNNITLIYSITIKEAPTAFEELLKQLLNTLHGDFIADSDFYEYIPDLINQMQHIAFCYNYYNCRKDQLPQDYPELIIKNFDNNMMGRGNLKDSLHDQCNFGDKCYSVIVNEQNLIRKVIDQLSSDQD